MSASHDPGVPAGAGQATSTLDRRSALKKAAISGAIVWAAPTVVSSKAFAQDTTCTPKCVPSGSGVTVSGSFEVKECVGNVPGAEEVFVVVSYDSVTANATCPCSPNPVVTVEDISPPAGVPTSIGGPGNVAIQVTISVTYTCFDNGGTEFTVTCFGFAGAGTSGNCNSRGGDVEAFSISLDLCSNSC